MSDARLINMRGRRGILPPGAVYIGRGMGRRYPWARGTDVEFDSPFHNPYAITKKHSRAEVIRLYREYLRSRPDLVERARSDLAGKVLACWCVPDACHGEVLLAILDGDAPPPADG